MSPKALLLVIIETSAFDTSKQRLFMLCGFVCAIALLRDANLELATGIENSSF